MTKMMKDDLQRNIREDMNEIKEEIKSMKFEFIA